MRKYYHNKGDRVTTKEDEESEQSGFVYRWRRKKTCSLRVTKPNISQGSVAHDII